MSKVFAHRRNFVYKRGHDSVTGLLPSSNAQGGSPSIPTVDSPATTPKVPVSINPPTIEPDQPTQSSTTPPAAATTPTQPTLATSPSSAASSSPANQASSSTSVFASSAAAHATSSAGSTPLSVAPASSVYATPTLATQSGTHISFAPQSTFSPTTSSSAGSGSSTGTNTGAIVGGIAGTLAGIAVLGFLLMWCMRRQRNKDYEDFDAQAFRRQSAVLVDDPAEPSRSYNPRPPTMIERHNASPALAAQAGLGTQNFYGNYGGYAPEMAPAGSSPPHAYGAQPMGYAGYSDPQLSVVGQQQLARQPSNATYLTRQPSSAVGFAHPAVPHDPSAQYMDLNRSSVTPYQAVQYADISRQLGTTDPNTQVPQEDLELPDGPLPSPFDDPVDANPATHRQGHSNNVAVPHTGPHRPATVYDEGDAYGGI